MNYGDAIERAGQIEILYKGNIISKEEAISALNQIRAELGLPPQSKFEILNYRWRV